MLVQVKVGLFVMFAVGGAVVCVVGATVAIFVQEFAVLVTIRLYVPLPEAPVEALVLLVTEEPAGAIQLNVTPLEVLLRVIAVLVQFTTPELEAFAPGAV